MQENQNQTQENVNVVEQNYIETIKKLKENSVSREDYDKVVNENKAILESVVNGAAASTNQEEEKQKRSLSEIRKELFSDKEKTNLHYVELALELRERTIEEGGIDPFLPIGKDIVIQNSDVESAERVAKVLQECVDTAQGDSAIFTNELQRKTRDVNIPKRR